MDGFAARRSRFRAVSLVDARTQNGTMRTGCLCFFRPTHRLAKSVDGNNLDPQDGSREKRKRRKTTAIHTVQKRTSRRRRLYPPISHLYYHLDLHALGSAYWKRSIAFSFDPCVPPLLNPLCVSYWAMDAHHLILFEPQTHLFRSYSTKDSRYAQSTLPLPLVTFRYVVFSSS